MQFEGAGPLFAEVYCCDIKKPFPLVDLFDVLTKTSFDAIPRN
jgi:hypothetical protein